MNKRNRKTNVLRCAHGKVFSEQTSFTQLRSPADKKVLGGRLGIVNLEHRTREPAPSSSSVILRTIKIDAGTFISLKK